MDEEQHKNEEQHKLEVIVSRSPGGNTDNYRLPLKHSTLLVTETDGSQGFGIHFDNQGYFEVRRDEKGQAIGFTVRVGSFTYDDLDGDGRIDGYLGPGDTGHIWIDSRFVPVRVGKMGLHSLAVVPENGSSDYHYQFREGQWQKIDEGLSLYEHTAGEWRKREL